MQGARNKVRVKMPGLAIFTRGVKELTLDVYSTKDLLKELKMAFPALEEKVFDKRTGSLYPSIKLMVNGKLVSDEDYRLQEGDEVELIPIFAGG